MFLRYNFLSVLWFVLIVVLSFLPGKDLPEVGIFQFDKLVHVVFYLLLFQFTMVGWKLQWQFRTLQNASGLCVFILCSVFGVLIECGQGLLTTDRFFDVYDAIANGIGALVGLTTLPFLKTYFRFQ
jgi:VanZ family protein